MKRIIVFRGLLIAITILASCVTEKKAILKEFKEGNSNVLVCPVHILDNQNSSYDTISSNMIADYINQKGYANAKTTLLKPPVNKEWMANEAKMLTISINKFAEFVKEANLPDNTYILYPEFYKRGKGSNIVAVHYCLLNNKGELAIRGLINSHWSEFQKIQPKTNNDCVKVFINGFEEKMKKE